MRSRQPSLKPRQLSRRVTAPVVSALMTVWLAAACNERKDPPPVVATRPAALTSDPQVLLVVRELPLSSADDKLKLRLEGLSLVVVAVAADVVTTTDAFDKSLIVISETSPSENVTSKFLNVSVPVVVLEPMLFDDMKMTGTLVGSHFDDQFTGQNSVVIAQSGHPLAAGLSGTVVVTDASQSFGWGVPGTEATAVARLVGSSTRATVFAYEAGATMVGAKAPGRRVGLSFVSSDVPDHLNTAGWQLFDAAVLWSLRPHALLVAGALPLGPSDAVYRARLEGLGHTVEVVVNSASRTSDATGKDVVVISDSVEHGNVTTKYTSVPVPVLLADPNLTDDMNYTQSGWNNVHGSTTGQHSIAIVASAHPMAAGLANGTVQVAASAGTFGWGKPASGASVVATMQGQATRAAIYGYEQNGAMFNNQTAAARRVGWFGMADALLNDNGKALFDAAIEWLVQPQALFVVGELTLEPGDQAIADRLAERGFKVKLALDSNVVAADANGKGIVVISESVSSTVINGEFSASPVPVLALEPNLYDDLGMTNGVSGTDYGTADAQQDLGILDLYDPSVQGMPNPVRITNTPATVTWGLPTSAAASVLSVSGQPGKAAIFSYEAGAGMAKRIAPARRTAFFAHHDTPVHFTDHGWVLFDYYLDWTFGFPWKKLTACIKHLDGTPCRNNSRCNQRAFCSDFRCIPLPKSCGDNDVCTDDVCNEATGVCSNPSKGNGGVCGAEKGCWAKVCRAQGAGLTCVTEPSTATTCEGTWNAPWVPPSTDPDRWRIAIHAALIDFNVLFFSGDQYTRPDADPIKAEAQTNSTFLYDVTARDPSGISKIESPRFPMNGNYADIFCSGHAQLPNGDILVMGGTESWDRSSEHIEHDHWMGLPFGFRFSAATKTWSEAIPMAGGRWYPNAITLEDGKVLVLGGHPGSGELRHTADRPELFDPASDTFSDLGVSDAAFEGDEEKMWSFDPNFPGLVSVGVKRSCSLPWMQGVGCCADPTPCTEAPAQLPCMDPRVSNTECCQNQPGTHECPVLGPCSDPGIEASRCCRGAPATKMCPAAIYDRVNEYPRMFLLPNGRVVRFPPQYRNGNVALFNARPTPTAPMWTEIGDGPTAWPLRKPHSSAVLLPLRPQEGYRARIVLLGSKQPVIADLGLPHEMPARGSWAFTPTSQRQPDMREKVRSHANATLLPTGEILVNGGSQSDLDADAVKPNEVYDSGRDMWRTINVTDNLTRNRVVIRGYHSTALLLPDGGLWIAGSSANAGSLPGAQQRRIELYDPWYKGGAERLLPDLHKLLDPDAVVTGSTFWVPRPAAWLKRYMLMRQGTVTHAFNSDQRIVELAYRAVSLSGLRDFGAGNLLLVPTEFHEVEAPPNSKIAPSGRYMLFSLDEAFPEVGRPSTLGKLLKVKSGANRAGAGEIEPEHPTTPANDCPDGQTCAVTPVAQCVTKLTDNLFTGWFGYTNTLKEGARIPAGANNQFTGSANPTVTPPTRFGLSGQTQRVLVEFSDPQVSWKLAGTTVTLDRNSTPCSCGPDAVRTTSDGPCVCSGANLTYHPVLQKCLP